MGISAKVIADSVARDVRLITMLCVFPRLLLAEWNTHRTFCLAGDMQLEFDLPGGSKKGRFKRAYYMRLDEFVDKWLNGARRTGAKPKQDYALSWVSPNEWYNALDTASRMGMANASTINSACRWGEIRAEKRDGAWWFSGASLLAWREHVPDHTRFDMQTKMRTMRIRQLNEQTGDIQWSHVEGVSVSGRKEILEVRAGDYTVAGSSDHRVLTLNGWMTLGELTTRDHLVVRKFGKRDDDRLDPLRLKKIDGAWRSLWQREQRERLQAEDRQCRRCRSAAGIEIHHVEPVHVNPSRAFDPNNITLLCVQCHKMTHRIQGWQGGTYLYGAAAPVVSIQSRGAEFTYDLSIAGAFPNFLANGVVVHNSRNCASSRAIPVEKRIRDIEADPFVPMAFGRNQKGMQASASLDEEANAIARAEWLYACRDAVKWARKLSDIGVHKQHANRVVEPYAYVADIVTATEWDNFDALRDSPMAQPEMQDLAQAMKAARDVSEAFSLLPGDWHLPLIQDDEIENLGSPDDRPVLDWVKISCARCARVSYLTHDGKRDPQADLDLYDRLASAGHMSPLEHAAFVEPEDRPLTRVDWVYNDPAHPEGVLAEVPRFIGNFRAPWVQHRKQIPGEDVFKGGQVG